MESKIICQWCASASGGVVRGTISCCRRIKEFIWKLFTGRPSGLPKIEIEEPKPVRKKSLEKKKKNDD